MARIFLSYARQDAFEAAENLRSKLSLAGHIVWRDIEDLRGGLSWQDQIRRQIEAVHCVIVLLTPTGVRSENVEHEWRTAFELNKRVLPILILPCTVPPELSRLHYHPAVDRDSYDRMLMVLMRDLMDIDQKALADIQPDNTISQELLDYIQEATRAYHQRIRDLLQVATAQPPLHPYKELLAFELTDGQIFFGRETDSKRLQRVILKDRVAVLHARSGAGKTSLVNAGLMPLLITAGFVPIYARAHTDPVEAIKKTFTNAYPQQKPPSDLNKLTLHQFLRLAEMTLGAQTREIVIILDQFEEFFVLYPQYEQRQRFIDAVAACYEDLNLRARFLFSLRKDYFSDMDEFKERLPGIFMNEFRLANLTRDQAMDAIVEPIRTVDPSVSYEQDLLVELLADLETSGMELPHLQIICNQLYTDRPEKQTVITLNDYHTNGRARGILGNYLSKTLTAFPVDERRLADEILFELVSSQSTKRILERERLITMVRAPAGVVDQVLDKLVNARLLRRDKDIDENQTFYEMAHEYLVDEIQRRAAADPTKMAAKQLQESLQRAVIEWNTSGILMNRALLQRFTAELDKLPNLTDDELACLLLTAISENDRYFTKHWLMTEPERSLGLLYSFVEKNLYGMLSRKTIAQMYHAGNSALPFLERVFSFDDLDIQKSAINALSLINTDGSKRLLAQYEIQITERRRRVLQERKELEEEQEYKKRTTVKERIRNELETRRQTQNELDRLRAQNELDRLRNNLEIYGPAIQIATVQIIGEKRMLDGIPDLIKLLKNKIPDVASAAAEALEKIATPEALAAVKAWRERK